MVELGCNGFWLASPSANNTNNIMGVNYNGNIDTPNYNNTNRGLRPEILKNCGCIDQGNAREVLDRNKPYPLAKWNVVPTLRRAISGYAF